MRKELVNNNNFYFVLTVRFWGIKKMKEWMIIFPSSDEEKALSSRMT